ncbi:unnamed protein product [Mycena citricolor]|uniref:Mitochondrial import inner membrane translocase subunit TIM50 n=1 Tax=Mycena citricolor TaxID=2018698 RepID=A0AAD2H3Z0_9AGAR|nr:unnamed protein product [Mycena citricolor]
MFSALTRAVPRRAGLGVATSRSLSQPSQPPSQPPQSPLSEPQPTADVSNLPSLDFSPEPEHQTGAKSSKDSLSSAEIRRRRLGRAAFGLLLVGAGFQAYELGREWEQYELKAKKITLENAPATRWGRTQERFTDMFDYFVKPVWSELLPPPLPASHQKPLTLVLSLDDLLVTSTWDRQHGWRTAKRPGVDYFLAYISQFYEVVIFTTQNSYTAAPILEKLDRYNFYISHRLFREATRTTNSGVVKDLSYLNRPLEKVVALDTNPEHVSTHPENTIVIPPWKGDPNDRGLIAMIPFLESIGIYKPADVRPILSAYQGKDIPVEYAKKEAESKAAHIEKWMKERPNGLARGGFASMLGLTGDSSPRPSVPPTYLEAKRKEAQENYMEELKYIREHQEYLESLLKKEQEMAMAAVPNTLFGALNQLAGEPPEPKQEQQDKPASTS